MPTNPGRKVWQHDVEGMSRLQLSEFLLSMGWVASDITPDYGEDLLVRVFDGGNDIGLDFYIQLKGTLDTTKHQLKSGDFSYSIDASALRQWHRKLAPVIIVLWDCQQRVGYWLHAQPFIGQALLADARWLDHNVATRSVRIPLVHELSAAGFADFKAAIYAEGENIARARQQIASVQARSMLRLDKELDQYALEPSRAVGRAEYAASAHPRVRQHELIAEREAVLARHPTSEDAIVALASVYYDLGDMDNALVTIRKIEGLKLQVTDGRTLNVLGSILAEYAIAHGGQPKSMLREALETFRSIHLPPPAAQATIHYNMGNTLMALGDYQEAIQEFDIALTQTPPPILASQIWKNRGTCHFHLGDFDEEFRSYRKALELDPNRWEAYSSWASTEMRLGNYQHALELLIEAERVNPALGETYPAHLYAVAFVQWKLGNLPDALRLTTRCLAISPTNKRARQLKTRILSHLWHRDAAYTQEAMSFFRALTVDSPDDILVKRELYLLYTSVGSQEQATELAKDTALPPDASANECFHYARMLEDEGDIDGAMHYLEMAVGKDPQHASIHKLAQLKERSGQYQDAIDLYKRIVDDEPVPIRIQLANCYFLLENWQESLHYCAEIVLREPADARWWNNLGVAAIKLGKGKIAFILDAFDAVCSSDGLPPEAVAGPKRDLLMELLSADLGEEFVESISRP